MDKLIVYSSLADAHQKSLVIKFLDKYISNNHGPSYTAVKEMIDHAKSKVSDYNAKYIIFQCNKINGLSYTFYRFSCWVKAPSHYKGSCESSMSLSEFILRGLVAEGPIGEILMALPINSIFSSFDVPLKYVKTFPSSEGEFTYINGKLIIFNNDLNFYSLYPTNNSINLIENHGKDQNQLQGEDHSDSRCGEGSIFSYRRNGPQLAAGRHCNQAGIEVKRKDAGGSNFILSTRSPEVFGSKSRYR